MLVTSKKTYTAILYDGSFASMNHLIETFDGATWRIDYEDGELSLELKQVPGRGLEYMYVGKGSYVIFENDRYNVYSSNIFHDLFRLELPSVDNSEPTRL